MFPHAINNIIADYAGENKLLPWIDESKLNWGHLSANQSAIKLLEKNQDKIDWDWLYILLYNWLSGN